MTTATLSDLSPAEVRALLADIDTPGHVPAQWTEHDGDCAVAAFTTSPAEAHAAAMLRWAVDEGTHLGAVYVTEPCRVVLVHARVGLVDWRPARDGEAGLYVCVVRPLAEAVA